MDTGINSNVLLTSIQNTTSSKNKVHFIQTTNLAPICYNFDRFMSKKEFSSSHTIQNHCSTSISILMEHPIICIINYWSPRNKDGEVHTYIYFQNARRATIRLISYIRKNEVKITTSMRRIKGTFPKESFFFRSPIQKTVVRVWLCLQFVVQI